MSWASSGYNIGQLDQLSDLRIALVVAGTESSLVISDNERVNDFELFSLSIMHSSIHYTS